MANTKNITDRGERKTAKRTQRKALRALGVSLTPKQRKKFRKARAEGATGLRKWLGEQASE